MPHLFTVGEPYIAGRTSFPEAVQYLYRVAPDGSAEHELLMWLNDLGSREVRDIRQGVAQFAMLEEGGCLWLLYRFGEMPWSDQPYHAMLMPEAEQAEPIMVGNLRDEPHAILHVTLVDAADGIVRGLRMVSWSPAFTAAWYGALRRQWQAPWPTREEYDRQLAEVYERYPTTRDMLAAATHRTTGGR